ncbi:MAG: L-threonylcarbamoyladenylate synthase [Candidatus Bathyarchaeia archaeon]|nr:threonylcarbamoyl-AMP synthase [Candidatus Bathyarchaeota archaeon]
MKKTVVLKVDPKAPNPEIIRLAADIIRNGGLVAFPTETVYGLGADALNPKAVLEVFKAKNRPLDNPPIVHVADIADVHRLAKDVPAKAVKLMERFWPGPLTLILKRSEIVPSITVSGLGTIAIRMPKHEVALALIRESGCPIAAPSANMAGRPSPTTAEHVLEDLGGRIDAILDAGPTQVGVESTVLDLTVEPPQILRPGGVPYEDLKEFLGDVALHPVAVANMDYIVDEARSPGMKYKHYAPRAKLIVVEGETIAVINKIKELASMYVDKGLKVGILSTDETSPKYDIGVVKSLGSRSNLLEIARSVFKLLREFDKEGVDIILAEGVPSTGLGLAVMNRLRKASGYNIIRV